jgi:3-hydroxyacyl-CoA dehydrogenase
VSVNQPVHRIAIVGAGVIGASGAAYYLARGFEVVATVMKTLGTPEIRPQLKQTVVDAVLKEAGARPVEQLAREENSVLSGLLKLRSAESA